ncbi:MAG: MFS transporter [Cyanobacteria bacterium P01_F01_bin.150]
MSASSLTSPPTSTLNLKTKLGYGIGEIGKEIPGSIQVFFLLFFLTDVIGLTPSLAGSVLLVGKIWDAVNDPIVGWLSDRTQSRWGRRFPWMIYGAIPLGISFFFMWWIPPFEAQWQLFTYYSTVLVMFYAALTSFSIPYTTLAAELTQTYDERTQLVSFKSSFGIGSSILGLIIAQIIFVTVDDIRLRYVILGAICCVIIISAAYICVWGTFQRYWQLRGPSLSASAATDSGSSTSSSPSPIPILKQFRIVFSSRPFLIVMGIYLCSWLALQTTAGILQYFVINWMGLPVRHFTQMVLVVQGTALAMMAFWSPLGQRIGKRAIYCWGIPLTMAAQVGLFLLKPGQVGWMYAMGMLAGFGLSTAYLVPWSMLPDVIDMDELQTGQRREGIFCALMVQLQKFGTAFAIFVVGRVLESSGYIAQASEETLAVTQPDSALSAIRWLLGPIPAVILLAGVGLATIYPISRSVHDDIVMKLRSRQQASTDSTQPEPEI